MVIISILLPVYNGEKTLKTTLNSLLNQTFKDFELLIGIDGTKDNCKSIAESFEDSRIKIFENSENIGLANNVNKLISRASSESQYFAMAEQDDVYALKRLEWQIKIMETNPDVGLVSGIAEFKSDNSSILFPGILAYNQQFPEGEALFKYLYVNQLKVVNTCMLWRKSIHKKHQLTFNNTYGNFNVDWDFILRFSLLSNIYGINKILVTMNRQKSNNSVTKDKLKQYLASKSLLNDFRDEFSNIISNSIYHSALKTHNKIELGHYKKPKLFFKSIYYTIAFRDLYFLRYFGFAINKAIMKKIQSKK